MSPPTPEERREIIRSLALEPGPRWRFRFGLMLSLSVVIAVMGLVANSAAVVIGAMLVAPLMTPVMAFAASTAMGWGRRMARSAAVVFLATWGSVALAWVLAALLPSPGLTTEMLGRTSPGMIDLLVALAAGAAGAYATVRPEVSTSLPGVAVAVALVPPLATVGVTMQIGRHDLARGAMLLYLANLVAVALCGVAVFVLTGFVPARRLRSHRRRFLLGVGGVSILVVAVAVPLLRSSYRGIQHAQRVSSVNQAVADWLFGSDLDVVGVSVSGSRVVVDLAGAAEPPEAQTLTNALVRDLGEGVDVTVRWAQRSVRSGATAPPPDKGEQLLQTARPIVRTWLDDKSPRGADFDILAVDYSDKGFRVDLAGPVAPPPAASLADALSAALGDEVGVDIRWSQRVDFKSTPGQTVPAAEEPDPVRGVVEAWAASNERLRVERLDVDRAASPIRVAVEVSGQRQPSASQALAEGLTKALGRPVEVEVSFTLRVPVPATSGVPAVTTTSTSSTPANTSTSR